MHSHRTSILAVGAVGATLLLTGCGGGEDLAGGPGETVEVTAVDYAFEGVPDAVAAGTTIALTNASDEELHELVAIRLPDDEVRTLDELLALPPEEQATLGEPSTVVVAPPGGDGFPVVGGGTVDEPGRYVLICAIPQGADPEAYMAAAQAAGDQAPDVGGGPPHVALGMAAEVEVR